MAHASSSLQPSPHASDQPCVGLAISEQEKAIFLPDESRSVLTMPDRANPDVWLELLKDLHPTVLVTGWTTPPMPLDWIADDLCPLRYVCHLTGTVRHKVPRAFLERGGIVTNWGPLVAAQVAEHALLLALSALRNAPAWMGTAEVSSAVKINLKNADTRTLFDRRIGVHGCGGVARTLASLLRPFSSRIDCHSAGVPIEVIQAAGMRPVGSLAELFNGKDILFECEALTPANQKCVNAKLLALLPDGALFVNVARGQLVDEAALMHEVGSGRLQAALDVLTVEPVPADSPWRALPGAIYSPHIAGPTSDMMPRIGEEAMNNLNRFLAGKPVSNRLTLELYDRST